MLRDETAVTPAISTATSHQGIDLRRRLAAFRLGA
jgi:hypothetical protein